MVVLSMSNFIRPKFQGAKLVEALELLDGKVPFVVLGAGLQGEHDLTDLSPSNQRLLKIVNERASLFGVRGAKTSEWLLKNGMENHKILGCPSLYVYPQSILGIDGSNAIAKGRAANVMTAGHLTARKDGIYERGTDLVRALQNIDASYVFQDEIFAYDAFISQRFTYNEGNNTADAKILNDWLSQKCGLGVNFKRYYYFSEAGAWRQATLLHDVYIGDRFHGGVAALQAGQPAIFLKHDNRVAELTDHFSLPALGTQKFVKLGLQATLEQFLSHDALEQMKSTYRKRHAEYTAALAEQGLELATHLV